MQNSLHSRCLPSLLSLVDFLQQRSEDLCRQLFLRRDLSAELLITGLLILLEHLLQVQLNEDVFDLLDGLFVVLSIVLLCNKLSIILWTSVQCTGSWMRSTFYCANEFAGVDDTKTATKINMRSQEKACQCTSIKLDTIRAQQVQTVKNVRGAHFDDIKLGLVGSFESLHHQPRALVVLDVCAHFANHLRIAIAV